MDQFLQRAGLVPWSADALAASHVPPSLCRVLHVAALLERDTAITVRHARSLGLHREPDLAVFLPQWDVEEQEHAAVFEHLLQHQSYEPPPPAPATIGGRRRFVAAVPLSLLGRLRATPFVFCVLGAAAEYLATTVYSMIARESDDPTVRTLVRDVGRQEARHFAFFMAAAKRFGRDLGPTDRLITRRALAAMWQPIGVPTLGAAGWWALFSEWMADDHFRSRVLAVDKVMGDLPHLNDWTPMADFLHAAGVG